MTIKHFCHVSVSILYNFSLKFHALFANTARPFTQKAWTPFNGASPPELQHIGSSRRSSLYSKIHLFGVGSESLCSYIQRSCLYNLLCFPGEFQRNRVVDLAYLDYTVTMLCILWFLDVPWGNYQVLLLHIIIRVPPPLPQTVLGECCPLPGCWFIK